MTRQQHHAEAERLLMLADVGEMERDGMRDRLIAAAQVHALLSLTADEDDVSGVPQ